MAASARVSGTGLLMYRKCAGKVEVLLAHPGGPYFRKKKTPAIGRFPKARSRRTRKCSKTAKREFTEQETGFVPQGPLYSPIPDSAKKGASSFMRGRSKEIATSRRSSAARSRPNGSAAFGKAAKIFPEVDRVEFFRSWMPPKKSAKFGQTELIDQLSNT